MSWRVTPLRRSQPSTRVSGEVSPRPRYSAPPALVLAIAVSVLLGRKRRFSADAKRMIKGCSPPPHWENTHCIPGDIPFVVVSNHYYKPGYNAWWGTAAITAAIAKCRPSAREMVWLMTNRWTYTNSLQSHLITPLTYLFFTRLARTYGFVSTPPMPRQGRYTEEGARSVRQVLSLLDSHPGNDKPVIGIAPEGRDSPDGSLIEPPSGAGRFLLHIAKRGLKVLPVGVAEIDGALTIRFGRPFVLGSWPDLSKNEQDRQASTQVMVAIGRQLPPELWGVYRAQIERISAE